jgi:hypothetical protein
MNFQGFTTTIQSIADYWFKVGRFVAPPPEGKHEISGTRELN